MSRRSSPMSYRRQLAIELRRLREGAGLTIAEVAKGLLCSPSKISRIETARVGVGPRDVRDMLELYGVNGEQKDALFRLAREARQKVWWHAYNDQPDFQAYMSFEDAAVSIRTFEAMLVPGLLQTEEYARAITAATQPRLTSEEIERRVQARMMRQARLTDDDPLVFSVVMDEAVLHRIVGGRRVMQNQLQHLLETAAQPNVSVQVLPFTRGQYVGMSGAFVILSFEEPAGPGVVYLEQTTGGFHIEGADQVEQYAQSFDQLRTVALTPEDSVAFLTRMLSELSDRL